ncbi:hypothetical protein REPUB_Repub18cG0005200 [Reevesia pubescens]
MRKIHGMGAGRKLRTHHKDRSRANKSYKNSNLGNEWGKPFDGSSGVERRLLHSLNYIEENEEVLIAGFRRKGHAVGDIPVLDSKL